MRIGHLEIRILNSRSLLPTYHFAKLDCLQCLCPLKDSLPLVSSCSGLWCYTVYTKPLLLEAFGIHCRVPPML